MKILTQAAEIPHLTEEQRKTVFDKVGAAEAFYEAIKQELSSQPLFKDASVTLD